MTSFPLTPHGKRLRAAGAMVAVLALAAALRLHDLARTDLWLDEAITLIMSNWSYSDLLVYPVDPTPGLYYMLHKALVPVDATVWQVRLLAVATGLLAVPLMYLLARAMFGPRAGWIAAILLAVWPLHVAHSQDARAYALLFAMTLGVSLGAILYARAWLKEPETPRQRRLGALALHAVFSVLALNTHVTAFLWVAGTALLLVLVAVLARRREAWLELGVYGVALALLSSPAIYRLSLDSSPDAFAWLGQASPKAFVITTLEVLLPPGPYGPFAASRALWIASGLLLAALGGLALLRNRLSIDPFALVAGCLVAGYLATPLAVWSVGFVATPVFMTRTILIAATGAILLMALVLAKAGKRTGGAATLVLVLIWGLTTALANHPSREHWKEAGLQLAARVRPGDVIIVCPAYKYPPLRHALARQVDAPLVVVDPDGRLLIMEVPFGSDREWARAYHRSFAVPLVEQRLARELQDPEGPPRRPAVPLRAGSTVWMIAGGCTPEQLAKVEDETSATLGPLMNVWNDTYAHDPLRLISRRVLAAGEISSRETAPLRTARSGPPDTVAEQAP